MGKTLTVILGCLLICAGTYRWGEVEFSSAKVTAMEQIYGSISKLFLPQLHFYDSGEEALVYRDMEQMIIPVLSGYRVSRGYTTGGQDTWEEDEWVEEVNPLYQDIQIQIVDDLTEFSGEEAATEAGLIVSTEKKQIINRVKLQDFDYLRHNFYQVDNTTTIDRNLLDVNKLLAKDLTLKEDVKGPQILIYHTHSQESYSNSIPGDTSTSVLALGNYLAQLLSQQYGIEVLHHTGQYDVVHRDSAYSAALPTLEQIIKENPTIEVVIDLHRDGVPETTHLITEVNGKPTAQIMFFNGLSRTTAQGNLTSFPNPYIEDNLAFSLQMQLAAAEYYPEFTRKIYLKGYRYNMHLCPKSLLVEVGAQTNTFEEAKNAMEPLADILVKVLYNQNK